MPTKSNDSEIGMNKKFVGFIKFDYLFITSLLKGRRLYAGVKVGMEIRNI